MRAKFDNTTTVKYINMVLLFIMLAAMFIVGYSQKDIFLIYVPAAVFLVIMCILGFFSGEIIADENGVTVVTTFLGIAVGKKFIEYGDIDLTDCDVETDGSRWGVSHTMIFTVKMKNNSIISVAKKLDIDANLPAAEPEKYKKYLSEQPLMQISHYIDGKLHLNASA